MSLRLGGFVGSVVMPPSLAEELAAAAAREGVSPAQMLRAAIDAAQTLHGIDAAAQAAREQPRARPWLGGPPRPIAGPPPGADGVRGRRGRSVARAASAPAIEEFCKTCGGEFSSSSDPCRCVSPGASPLAAEAEDIHPAGLAVARMLARRTFSPRELSLARNSVAQHGGAACVALQGPIDGASAFFVCRSLDAARAGGAKAIVLDVASEGGSVPAGLAVIRAVDRLRAEGVPTIANVARRADSMASVIAVSCAYGVMGPGASMTIHEASGGRDDHLAILRDKLLAIYEARTLTDRAQLAGYLAGAVSLDAQAAHSLGFVDEVAGPERVETIARAAGRSGSLYATEILAANSWRRTVLRERQADAAGVVRYGPRPEGRGL